MIIIIIIIMIIIIITTIIIIIMSGPNENSQKASISVNVLAANSQDEVFE